MNLVCAECVKENYDDKADYLTIKDFFMSLDKQTNRQDPIPIKYNHKIIDSQIRRLEYLKSLIIAEIFNLNEYKNKIFSEKRYIMDSELL